MPSWIKKFLFCVFLVFIITATFVAGFELGGKQISPNVIFGVSNPELGKPQNVDFSLFWQTWNLLEEKYAESDNLDRQKMIYGAISGMVKSADDPYTVFMDPEDSKRFFEDVNGSFGGVGMEVGIRQNQLQVISPLEGTPADKAGLRAGDKIVKVNDIFTADISIEEAVSLIRGDKGTEVVLTISRDDWKNPKEIKIIRDIIKVPSLKWEVIEGDIVYIKLYQFSLKANDNFKKTAIKILNMPQQKIILDLRNNPGGYLNVAQDIAGWFLKKGNLVTIEDFGKGKDRKEYKAKGTGALSEYQIVILVNQGSASASEILAGALRDNNQVLLIGETTFGKGSVQEMTDLIGGSSLKVTVAKWLTPNGEFITGKGLEPDIKVEMTEEDYNKDRDPQLDKAIEKIKEMK